jgi:hypothetical protein
MDIYETKDTDLVTFLTFHRIPFLDEYPSRRQNSKGFVESWFRYDQTDASFNYYYGLYPTSDFKRMMDIKRTVILPIIRKHDSQLTTSREGTA